MVLLPDGKVLIVGGRTLVQEGKSRASRYENSCELYDPKSNTCVHTGSMNHKYGSSTCVVLKSGKVLVVGRGEYPYAKCELYDPNSGEWSVTGSLITPRDRIYATMLSNGHVLVAGGDRQDKTLALCDLYDPQTKNWKQAGSLTTPRAWHKLVLLGNGKVLAIAGEKGGRSCELYDPDSDKWIQAPPLLANHGIFFFAVGLVNGKVLVTGGSITHSRGHELESIPVLSSELYDPAANSWKKAATLPHAWNSLGATVTMLANGDAVLIGRNKERGCLLYDNAKDEWRTIPEPITPRSDHAAIRLPNGRIVISGGYKGGVGLQSTLTSFETLSLGLIVEQTRGRIVEPKDR
jgi:hypothetical protein